MGSISAMSSIDRVIEKHGDEILAKLKEDNPSSLIKEFALGNEVYSLSITATLTDGAILTLSPLDIDHLAEEYPDCEVGY